MLMSTDTGLNAFCQPMEFNGSLEELKVLVSQLGVPCQWQHKGAFELARFEDGVSNLKLNWWPQRGAASGGGSRGARHPGTTAESAAQPRALSRQHRANGTKAEGLCHEGRFLSLPAQKAG
jgi:hypothetical protein